MAEFKVGDHVEITGKDLKGEISFIGTTEFAQGKWIGVILPEPKGKNDGTVQGKSYFKCKPNHGMFVRQNQVTLIKSPAKSKPGTKPSSRSGTSTPKSEDGDPEPATSGIPTSRSSGLPTSRLSGLQPPRSRLSMMAGTGSRVASKSSSRLSTPASARGSTKGSTDDIAKSSGNLSKSPSSVSNASSADGSTAPSAAKTPVKKTPSRGTDNDKKNQDKKKDAEIATLQASLKDMEEKVQFLTAKRVEDKAKIKEMEKYKVQISQFTDYKAQWSSAQGDLHEQLKAAKKEAKESSEARTKAETELEELRDRVEEMALDKEMAEEMKECAELELERVQEQYDETKQELDLMKEEISSGGGGNVDNVRIKQLEMQTNQLKEAVVKLKELNTQDRKEIESLTAQLTKEQSTVAELTKLKDNLEEELEEHETMVGELTEQVECCIGAETMVEKLTETNLELEERLNMMAGELADLEALRDLNEELEEERMVTERELREELEISRNTHYQQNMKIEEQAEQNNDLQNVIMQFRAYVNQLQAQLKDTQAQMSQEREMTEGVDEEKLQQLAQMRAQLLEQNKTAPQQDSYDVDFAEIEVLSHQEEVRLLKLFFPERFTQPGSDYEALKLILHLNKLGVTSEVIGRVSSRHLKLTDLLSGTALSPLQSDKAMYAAGLALELAYFRVAVTNFERCIKQCDPDTFLRLGRLASDLGPHMSTLDVFKTHLEKGSLDESVTVEPVKLSASQFTALSNTHFPDIKPSCREALSDYLMIMTHSCEGIIACATRISGSLSRVQEGSVLIEKMNEMRLCCAEFLKTIRRIKNFVPAHGKPFSFPSEIDDMLNSTMTELSATFAALNTTAVNLAMHIAGVAEDDIVTVPDIEDILKKGCNTVGTTGTGLDRVKSFTESLLPPLQQMAKNIQDGDYDQQGDADTKSEPPYDARAKQFKEQFSLGDQLKTQLEYKQSENFELKKMVKIKGEEVSQQAVRADMLEKRLENARRDGDGKLDAMKQELADAKKTIVDKDRQFEETMDHLQEDIESLEAEKTALKTKLEQASKRAPRAHLTESILAEQASGQPGSVRVIVEDSPATLSKLESLQNYAQLVQEENVKLMADSLKTKLAELPPLVVPTAKSPDVACEKGVNELHQQLLNIIANTKVIDITKKTNGKIPADVLAEQKSTRVCLHNQYLRLKLQAQKEMGRYYGAGGFIKTPNGEFVTPEFARVLKEKESSRLFGKITLPHAKESGVRKILLDKSELARLNATLLAT